jgi:hypothetical protein
MLDKLKKNSSFLVIVINFYVFFLNFLSDTLGKQVIAYTHNGYQCKNIRESVTCEIAFVFHTIITTLCNCFMYCAIIKEAKYDAQGKQNEFQLFILKKP